MTTKKTPKTASKTTASKTAASKTAASKTADSKTADSKTAPSKKTTAKTATATATAAATTTPTTARKTTRTKPAAPMVVSVRRQPSYQDIAERAFALFQARGYAHGYHLQDWLQAEQEVYAALR